VRDPCASRHADKGQQPRAWPGSTGRTAVPRRRRHTAVNRHMDRIVGLTRELCDRNGRGAGVEKLYGEEEIGMACSAGEFSERRREVEGERMRTDGIGEGLP